MTQLSRDWHFEECEKEGCNNGAVVGFSNGEIHVCSVYAALPEFSRMKPTVLLKRLTQRTPAPQPAPVAQPELTVWYGAMPESNGKTNWTATLRRKDGGCRVFTIDHSEYPDRVRYEADRMRWLIGELPDEPDILAYDANKHSGYVPPVAQPVQVPEPIEMDDDFDSAFEHGKAVGWNACRASMLSAPQREQYQHLSELYHAQEKRLFKIAQRIKDPSFDKYAHSTSQAIDVLEPAIFGENNDACRAAMLQPSQWIPCSERMPEENGYFLVRFTWPGCSSDYHQCMVLSFLYEAYGTPYNEWRKIYGAGGVQMIVTHWMPLPAAPQEPTK